MERATHYDGIRYIMGSMQLNGSWIANRPVTRLDVVKIAARQFIEKRKEDKIGLILFGSIPYLQTPLTYDKKTVIHMLDDATVGLAGQATALGDAIGLAIKRLKNVSKLSRILILLTDGANNTGMLDPLKAATLAKNEGIKIYTIGVGSDETQSSLFNFSTLQPTPELDEITFKKNSFHNRRTLF